jgi:hypothetical protein
VATLLEAVTACEPPLCEEDTKRTLESVVQLVPRHGLDLVEERRRCLIIAPLLPWVHAALTRSVSSADIVERCTFLLRRIAWAAEDKVLLMRVVDSAVAAMDTHRGVAAVAEHGLCFLSYVSLADPNRVRRLCLL